MALAKLLPQFAPNCPVPIVIVQHMPPVFTRHLAERLTQLGSFSVVEGDANSELKNGQVVIAPGGHHLVLAASS